MVYSCCDWCRGAFRRSGFVAKFGSPQRANTPLLLLTPSVIPVIPNHYAPPLSELDLRIVRSVPPGGNWKHVPEDVPSKRIQQIRESYKAGKGSRSTYYGRLHPESPSYTINTYFSRPGNGCHIHYEQERVLSQREAARLQSFPDSFQFLGSRSAVNTQIGNAVPPLLGFQIARQIGSPSATVDLFCGAGGLSLGFKWAGWQPVVSTDFDKNAVQSFAANVHPHVVHGDIRAPDVFGAVTSAALSYSSELWVLGGPPCQGFSTAGNRRSMEDSRNHLFKQYVAVLAAIRPKGFVFENVTGLLSMSGGRVFTEIRSELQNQGYETAVWRLQAETYGIPQRRTRVIVIGTRDGSPPPPPPELTRYAEDSKLPRVCSVRDALHDLPLVSPGEDGSMQRYRCSSQNPYQAFVRGEISAPEYISALIAQST